MNILAISFSVNGSMGDNFFCLCRNLAKENALNVITNFNVGPDRLGTSNVLNIKFDKKRPLDFVNPISYYHIYKYIHTHPYDICFIYSPHPVNTFIYRVVDQKKLVQYMHDPVLHSGESLLNRFFFGAQYWDYYKNSARIIVSCQALKQLIATEKLVKDLDRVSVVYLGFLDNLAFPILDVEQDIDVLFFGRIEYYKGLDILVTAARRLPNVSFVVAGKGDIHSIQGIEKLPANVKHINRYVPDEELAQLIQHAKVAVFPYRDATGTQTIQTVYYYQRPVIVSKVGCFPEYVPDGFSGYVIPPCDVDSLVTSIQKLILNKDLSAQMGRNGKNLLQTVFSNERLNNEYISVFKRTIEA
jgi:glycosyltransferase involved in cell wall biosynthesis